MTLDQFASVTYPSGKWSYGTKESVMIYPDDDYSDIYRSIVRQNRKRERDTLGSCATSTRVAVRRKNEEVADSGNLRPAFFRDADRILHCSAYARYFDKTQVFFQTDNDHVTRRVLHVQLVAKMARTLARFFQLNEDLFDCFFLCIFHWLCLNIAVLLHNHPFLELSSQAHFDFLRIICRLVDVWKVEGLG